MVQNFKKWEKMSLTQIAQIAKLDHTDKQTLDILALYENHLMAK